MNRIHTTLGNSSGGIQPRMALAIHLMIWLYIFLAPLVMFSHEGESITFNSVCHRLYFPVISCGMFYLNYFLLVPRFLMNRRFRAFVVYNVLLILLFTILHEALILRFVPFEHHGPHHASPAHGPMHPHPDVVPPPDLFLPTPFDFFLDINPLFFLRNSVSLAFITVLSIIVKLSLGWHQAETARRQAELARTEAELRNLKNQLNPHFLLNTLNNIYALTSFDVEKAREAILELSGLMRYLLYEDQSTAISLRREIDFLERYIGLMKLRINDNVDLQFTTHITSKSEVKVAPLIFICLVENAFKHGISPGEPCYIHIRVEADEHHIAFACANTNHPKTTSDKSPGGIGLRQVTARLNHFYTDHYRWEYGPSVDGSIYTSRLHIEY